jgi:hypothetical protein
MGQCFVAYQHPCLQCLDMNYDDNGKGDGLPRGMPFKRTCVGSNGILECKFLPENAHRASATPPLSPTRCTSALKLLCEISRCINLASSPSSTALIALASV